jgi:hypothetical protein
MIVALPSFVLNGTEELYPDIDLLPLYYFFICLGLVLQLQA